MNQSLAATRWEWDDTKRRAVVLLAEGGKTYQQLADELGISRITLWEWRKTPEFAAALAELQAMLADESRQFAVANRRSLLEGLTERRERLLRIVAEREAHHREHRTGHPGATTGYLVKSVKNIGSGPTAYPVDEWAVDRSLVTSLNEVETFGAKLAGVLVDRQQVDAEVRPVQPAIVRFDKQVERPDSVWDEEPAEGRYEELLAPEPEQDPNTHTADERSAAGKMSPEQYAAHIARRNAEARDLRRGDD